MNRMVEGGIGPVVVTGATGFLGRHLMPVLARKYGTEHLVGVSSRDYDLMNPAEIRRMLTEHRPTIVVHLAAYVGGIGANRKFPADFFFRNIVMTVFMFHAAVEFGVRKILYPIGGCSYPATAASPIDETQMWDGYPQADSGAYAMAKKMGLVASCAYRQQYGLETVVIVPGNMYGEYDNFRTEEAHVIPALIRRIFEAERRKAREVVVWGTGNAVRDFVYAGDVAAVVPFFLECYDSPDPVNISSGRGTTIRELAETIADLLGYKGSLVWDRSKPEGQMVKVFDVSRMRALGLHCPTPLREGLRRTVEWFVRNYDSRADGIRL